MSRYDIVIDCILVSLAAFIYVSVWRRFRNERARRRRWPAMNFSNITTEAGVPSAPPDGLLSFSANFDPNTVRPFLERIQLLIEAGFGSAQIEQVERIVATLAHDQEQTLKFQIRHAGKETGFQIQVVMGDLNAPDLYFLSPPSLTRQIKSAFVLFAKERGI